MDPAPHTSKPCQKEQRCKVGPGSSQVKGTANKAADGSKEEGNELIAKVKANSPTMRNAWQATDLAKCELW